MTSEGNNSPVVNAGRDAVINIGETKPDFVTDHDGAGAVLMTEPDFKAWISMAVSGPGEKFVGRLINGTAVQKLELREAAADGNSPPWARVKILEGDLKGRTGWILMSALRRP